MEKMEVANKDVQLNNSISIKQADLVQQYLKDIDTITKKENSILTPEQRAYCVPICHAFVKRVINDRIDPKQINSTDFLEQVKHFAKLGLSIQDKEIFLDIRNNKNTGMKDVTIMKQYQGIQKEMVRFSKKEKEIVRFLDGVVCKGDKFVTETDFANGLQRIKEHTKNTEVDRNNLLNIESAYAIAYCKEKDNLVPYIAIIDKNRIMRAYNASPTDTKIIWKQDTARMVIKTAYWVLANSIMKPFIEIPADLKTDWEATNDKMDFDKSTTDNDGTEYDIDNDITNDEKPSEKAPEKESIQEAQATQLDEQNDDFIE